MENIAKGLVGVAALGFVLAVVAAFTGGEVMSIPGESFSRACENLALIAIALLLLGKKAA